MRTGTSRWRWALGGFLAVGLATSARADQDGALHWEQIVGLIQPGNLVGTGDGQVTGGGQPWSTRGGTASVDLATGHLEFHVRGLVLAGGNFVGGTDGIAQVKGTLVCDTNGSSSVLVDTPLVTLDPQGDAQFDGDVGPLPTACTTQPDLAFLVRIPAGRWIANGAVLIR